MHSFNLEIHFTQGLYRIIKGLMKLLKYKICILC